MRLRLLVVLFFTFVLAILPALPAGAEAPPAPPTVVEAPPQDLPPITIAPEVAPNKAWSKEGAPESGVVVEPGNPLAASGGPDGYGHTFSTGSGVLWYDAKTFGINTGLAGDDAAALASIGFSYQFYENTYTQMYVSTNGLISFGRATSEFRNGAIPRQNLPTNIMAPFWDDLIVGTGGVYVWRGGVAPNRYCVVEWYQVQKFGEPGSSLTFEALFLETVPTTFWFQYQTMTGTLTSASIGIEDDTGGDGLQILHNAAGLSDNTYINISSSSTGRVKVYPLTQGILLPIGQTGSTQMQVRNIGSFGNDTYDLVASPASPISFFRADGVTALTDTDGSGVIDTGPVAQNSVAVITIKIQTPPNLTSGPSASVEVQARSQLNPAKTQSASIHVAIPSNFTQAYGDDSDGAQSLYLVQPSEQTFKKVTPDGYSAAAGAVAEMTNGNMFYVWAKSVGGGIQNIEYTIRNREGATVQAVTKLTDHTGAPNTQDSDPTVAVAPNGQIGVTWVREYHHLTGAPPVPPYYYNYNVWFAILDADGTLAYGPANVTGNAVDLPPGLPGYVDFTRPRIAATGNNRFALAWERYQFTDSKRDVWYAIRDSNGAVVKAPTNFTGAAPGAIYVNPGVTRLRGNRFFLTYINSISQTSYAVLDSVGAVKFAPTTLDGVGSQNPAAVQLSGGRILVAWTNVIENPPALFYALLDGTSYAAAFGPTKLPNSFSPSGDDYVSVTFDANDRGVLTWTDYDRLYRRNLFYALIQSTGEPITLPLVYHTSLDPTPRVLTSLSGYGNTTLASATVLPVILDDAYGGWTTGINLRNSSAATAPVRVVYYNASGTPAATDVVSVPPNGYTALYQGGKFGAGWAGSAEVLSDLPVVAEVNELGTGDAAMGYSGYGQAFAPATTLLYLPAVMDDAYGGWTTGIGIRNTSSSAASVTVKYYNGDGTLAKSELAAIPAKGYVGLYQGGKLGAGWAGSAIITSNQPIVAVVNEVQESGKSISYNPFAWGRNQVYLPAMLNNAYGGWTTGVSIQNTTSLPATGTIKYYDGAGTLKKTQAINLPPNGTAGVYQGSAGLPSGFTGSAMISMDEPVVAVVNEVKATGDAMGYGGVVATLKEVNLPVVMDNSYGGWNTGLGIQNTIAGSADVTVTFYDGNGTIIKTESKTIAANGYWGLYQGGGNLGEKAGSARIVSNRALAVIVNETGPAGQAVSYNGTP